MNGAAPSLVLHGTLVVPGAVRVPRSAPRTPAPPAAALPEAALPSQDAGYQEGLRLGLEQGRRNGHEEGLRSGYAQGLSEGTATAREQGRIDCEAARLEALRPLEEHARSLEALLQSIKAVVEEARAMAEDDITALCYEVLCRLLGEAARTEQDVRARVACLLAGFAGPGPVTLHVHPQDLVVLDQASPRMPDSAGAAAGIRWIADPQVALGGCVLEGAAGGLDARLETVLEQCKAGLLAARRGADKPAGEHA